MADIRTEQARRQRRFFRFNGGQGVRALAFLRGDTALAHPIEVMILLRREWRPTEKAAESSFGASIKLEHPEIDFLDDAIPGGTAATAQDALISVVPSEIYRLVAAGDPDVAKVTFQATRLGKNDIAKACQVAGLDAIPVPDPATWGTT